MALLAIADPYEDRGWKFLAMIVGPSGSLIVLALSVWSSIRFIRAGRYALATWCLMLGAVAVASWWGLTPLARRWSGWGEPKALDFPARNPAGVADRVDHAGDRPQTPAATSLPSAEKAGSVWEAHAASGVAWRHRLTGEALIDGREPLDLALGVPQGTRSNPTG